MENKTITNHREYEIKLSSIKSASFFFGYKVFRPEEVTDETKEFAAVNDTCELLTSLNHDTGVGRYVGVFLRESNQWVRGRVKRVVIRGEWENSQFKVFLLDLGEYVTVLRRFVCDLPGRFHYPPRFLKIALDGVLPCAWTDQEKNAFVTGVFKKGALYLRERTCENNIHIGDIFLKRSNKSYSGQEQQINIKLILLKKGFVKIANNFNEEFEKYSGESLTFSEDEYDVPHVKLNLKTSKEELGLDQGATSQISTKGGEGKCNQDTGYSSDDDAYPRPHETAVCLPPGIQFQPKPRNPREPVKPLRTHYQIENERKRSKSENRSREKSCERPQSRLSEHSIYETRELIDKSLNVSTQPVQRQARVSFGKTRTLDESDLPPKRGFNLSGKNMKSALKSDRSDVSSGDDRISGSSSNMNKIVVEENSRAVSSDCSLTKTLTGGKSPLSCNTSCNNSIGMSSSSDSLTTGIDTSNQSLCHSMNTSMEECKHQLQTPQSKLSRMEIMKKIIQYAEQSRKNQSGEVSVKSQSDESYNLGDNSSSLNVSSRKSVDSSFNTTSNSYTIASDCELSSGMVSTSINDSDVSLPSFNTSSENSSLENKNDYANSSMGMNEAKEFFGISNSKWKAMTNFQKVKLRKKYENVLAQESARISVNSLETVSDNKIVTHEVNILKTKSNESGVKDMSNYQMIKLPNRQEAKRLAEESASMSDDSKKSVGTLCDRKIVKEKPLKQVASNQTKSMSNFQKIKLRNKQEAAAKAIISGNGNKLSETDSDSWVAVSVCSDNETACKKEEDKKILKDVSTYGWRAPAVQNSKRLSADAWHEMDQLMSTVEIDEPTNLLPSGSTVPSIISSAEGLLVHTMSGKRVSKILNLYEASLNMDVVKEYEQFNLRDISRVQQVAIPAIIDRRNIAMISPPRTGKTTGYIIPIASCLLNPKAYPNQDREIGSRVIVLTPCCKSGYNVANTFEKLSRKLSIVLTHGGGAEEEKKDCLLIRPDVVVSTPRCLERLLKKRYTNVTNLYHLVLDDADILLEKFLPEMRQLIFEVNAMEMGRREGQRGVQVIVTATKWTKAVAELVPKLEDATLVIAAPMEALLYVGVKPVLKMCHRDMKKTRLAELIQQINNKKRTLIMCKSKEDAVEVYTMLKDLKDQGEDYLLLAAHEDISSIALSELPQMWNSEKVDQLWGLDSRTRPIMVRSDPVLDEYPIRNAEVLIHYNMPATLKTFSLRFASLIDNFPNLLKGEKWDVKPDVYTFLDHDNDEQAFEVLNFTKRAGVQLPDKVEAMLKECEDNKEKKKMHLPLCGNLKQFGECNMKKDCNGRHIVCPELDIPAELPKSGKVKILIQRVFDVCHFSARIIEHSPEEGVWNKMSVSNNIAVLSMKINNFYANEENRRLHGHPSIGDLVAVKVATNEFKRAIVLKIARKNTKNEPERVDIRYIDDGNYHYDCPVIQLWGLPAELAEPPGASVEVYLCGVAPTDEDPSWSSPIKDWMERLLHSGRREHPEGFLCGQIVLSLGQSLWLDPLELKEFLPSIGMEVSFYSFSQKLLDEKFAVKNPDHMKTLYSLCDKAKIDIGKARLDYEMKESIKPTPIVRKPVQVKPQWAWLPRNELENVHIITVQAPSVIFVRITSFNHCLTSLEREIEKHMKEEKNKDDLSQIIDIGDVCLGKSPGEDQWNRALVKSITENKLEVFFVDYGDYATLTWSEVTSIPNSFITQLPFQVIECCLAGITFIESDDPQWEEDFIDQIYDHSRNIDEVALELKVQVCDLEPQGLMTEGRKYKVILGDSSGTINDKITSEHVIKEDLGKCLVTGCEEQESGEPYPDSDEAEVDNVPKTRKPVNREDIEIINTIKKEDGTQEQFFTEDFDPKKALTKYEKDYKVWQFLKDIYDGKFEHSSFPIDEGFEVTENDADISEDDNQSEGSAFSVPQPRRLLPQLTEPPVKIDQDLPGVSLEEVNESISSQSVVSSSLLSLTEKNKNENCEVLNQDYLDISAKDIDFLSQCTGTKIANAYIDKQKEISNTYNLKHDGCVETSSGMNLSGNAASPICLPKTSPIAIITSEKSFLIPHISPSGSSSSSKISCKFADLISPSLKKTCFNIEIDDDTDLDEYINKGKNAAKSRQNNSFETCPGSAMASLNQEQKTCFNIEIDDDTDLVEYINKGKNAAKSRQNNSFETCPGSAMASLNQEQPVKQHGTSPRQLEPLTENIDKEGQETNDLVKQKEITYQEGDENVSCEYKKKWIQQSILSDTDEESSFLNVSNHESGSPSTSVIDSNTNFRIPFVEWHQSDDFVWIYIKLPGLVQNQAEIRYDITSVDFRVNHHKILYGVSLKFFGAHKFAQVLCGPKAFHYEIRLEKLLKGKKYHWPRLTQSVEKLYWLKYNLEKSCENVEETEDDDVKNWAESLRLNVKNDDTLSQCSDESDYACSEISEQYFGF